MSRYVSQIEVMGRGRYRVTVKSKRWWQRRWRSTTYTAGQSTIIRWEDASQPGVVLPTDLSWFLTDVIIAHMAQAREAMHAAR